MIVRAATDRHTWDAFLKKQRFSPFLQSWAMGEVYRDIGQEPIRLEVIDDEHIVGICQAIIVPARRGKHVMVQYGPLVQSEDALSLIITALKDLAAEHRCSFIRISPFWTERDPLVTSLKSGGAIDSPLHLLSEYTWYISLKPQDRWNVEENSKSEIRLPAVAPKGAKVGNPKSEQEILGEMRKTTRNLIGRAEREGVTVTASTEPTRDLDIYFKLQEETYKRHKFVPYRESFIRAQVKHFSASKDLSPVTLAKGEAIVYIARYNDEPVAASVHMSFGGVTSYHHGASTHKYAKIPASYLLQWTAIRDALRRGDDIYNFWGIAPRIRTENGDDVIIDSKHPFAGVTTFKTGFGGMPLPLMHCVDIPVGATYRLTRAFEFARKWRRGF